MKKIDQIAEKILLQSNLDPNEKFGSILLIVMMIGILLNLIRVIQECDKQELSSMNINQQSTACESYIKNFSIRKSWYTKMKIKKILRKNMPLDAYKQYGSIICDNMLLAGEKITSEEVYSLIEASNV